MSFDIVLQTNTSPSNQLDKELTTLVTLTGTLREQCSIIDPVIMIYSDSIPSTANYMTIETFGRSYFIKNITSIRAGLWQIEAHVDVLSSFKTGIRENSAIVKKQESQYNLLLNDGSLKVYQNPYVLTKSFPSGFSDLSFVLTVAGG